MAEVLSLFGNHSVMLRNCIAAFLVLPASVACKAQIGIQMPRTAEKDSLIWWPKPDAKYGLTEVKVAPIFVYTMPVAKPDTAFSSFMPVITPDSSMHDNMPMLKIEGILRPERD